MIKYRLETIVHSSQSSCVTCLVVCVSWNHLRAQEETCNSWTGAGRPHNSFMQSSRSRAFGCAKWFGRGWFGTACTMVSKQFEDSWNKTYLRQSSFIHLEESSSVAQPMCVMQNMFIFGDHIVLRVYFCSRDFDTDVRYVALYSHVGENNKL